MLVVLALCLLVTTVVGKVPSSYVVRRGDNLSKIARKKYVRTANLKMPSGKVEIGLDESKSCLYGVVLDQTTKRIGIQHLGDIKTLLDEENK